MPIRNITIAAGTVAQDLLPAFHGTGGFIVTALDENGFIQFGSDASPTNGETLVKSVPSTFSYKEFPELNARVSVYSATTGSKLTLRPIS